MSSGENNIWYLGVEISVNMIVMSTRTNERN